MVSDLSGYASVTKFADLFVGVGVLVFVSMVHIIYVVQRLKSNGHGVQYMLFFVMC